MMLRSTVIAVCLSLFALPAHADEARGQSSQVVADFGNEALLMLSETWSTPKRREDEFRRLLLKSFDVSAMGRTIAGRYWVRATEAEQAEYLRLFEDYLVRIHAQRLGQYFGAAIKIEGEESNGPDTFVTTSIEQPNKAPILVVWRVFNRAGAYRIVDVSVSGVSMLLTQRSEFMSVMQNGGGKLVSLFPPLRQKIAAAE
jgi:phospholipid transport system substrate-binding protein